MLDLNTLTIGQEIGIVRHYRSYSGIAGHSFSTVAKINGHGHIILADGRKFNKHGSELGDGYTCLENPDDLRKLVAEASKKKAVHLAVSNFIKEVEQVTEANRTGGGVYHGIPKAEKARLVEMLSKLAVSDDDGEEDGSGI